MKKLLRNAGVVLSAGGMVVQIKSDLYKEQDACNHS